MVAHLPAQLGVQVDRQLPLELCPPRVEGRLTGGRDEPVDILLDRPGRPLARHVVPRRGWRSSVAMRGGVVARHRNGVARSFRPVRVTVPRPRKSRRQSGGHRERAEKHAAHVRRKQGASAERASEGGALCVYSIEL